MRIHTALTETDIQAAARRAGADFVRLNVHGSRRAPRAFDVILTGSALHNCHWSRSGDYRAATWDEWGIFLDLIFRRDPKAWIKAYTCQSHFKWATGGRYEWLLPDQQHPRHKWEYAGIGEQECACGAVKRWLVGRDSVWTPEESEDAPEVDTYGERYETYHGPYESQGHYESELALACSH